jgi:ABC-type multidrug transport system fused ATPase/permease subunit
MFHELVVTLALLLVLVSFRVASNRKRYHQRLQENDTSCKELTASWYARITFSFLDDLITLGSFKTLEFDDLDAIHPDDETGTVLSKYDFNSNLLHSLYNLVKTPFIVQQILTIIWVILVCAQPVLFKLLMVRLETFDSRSEFNEILVFASLLVLATALWSLVDAQINLLGRRMGMRVRSVLLSQVYEKSLKKLVVQSSIDVNTIVSVDVRKILDAASILMNAWAMPLEFLFLIGLLIHTLGMAGLVGLCIMTLMLPLTTYLGKKMKRIQRSLMEKTDCRLKQVKQLLRIIEIVKLFAWESKFAKNIHESRDAELKLLFSYTVIGSLYRSLWLIAPVIVGLSTFAVFTLWAGEEMTISAAFTSLLVFQLLQFPLQEIPQVYVELMEAGISLERISGYLMLEEITTYIHSAEINRSLACVKFSTDSVFEWPSYNLNSDGNQPFKFYGSGVEIPDGKLTVIYGPSASGKTAFVQAAIGRMKCVSGDIKIHNGATQRNSLSIALVSQTSWLQNTSVRENITFGCEFSKERYDCVVECCALKRDLMMFPGGDQMKVGENGNKLSGGQKARIALARAIYSNIPLVILDDPLSAVDAPTARYLLDNAICGPLMKNRTRILVTNSIGLCCSSAFMLLKISNGRPNIIDTPIPGESLEINSPDQHSFSTAEVSKDIRNEENPSISRTVSYKAYTYYLNASGGYVFAFLLSLSFGGVQLASVAGDYWIKLWADAAVNSDANTLYYVKVYALFGCAVGLTLIFRILVLAWGSVRASKTIHSLLTEKVLRLPLRFYHSTPIGKIINRFSKDMKDIDQEVSLFAGLFLATALKIILFLLVIVYVHPLVLCSMIPVALLYGFIGYRYLNAAKELKRIDSSSRSPIFSLFSESGL